MKYIQCIMYDMILLYTTHYVYRRIPSVYYYMNFITCNLKNFHVHVY